MSIKLLQIPANSCKFLQTLANSCGMRRRRDGIFLYLCAGHFANTCQYLAVGLGRIAKARAAEPSACFGLG
jgi:hypothetical protein